MTKATANQNYDRAKYSELWQVYGRYSHAKENAMDYCKRSMRKRNGYGGKITSWNSFQFSYAFEFIDQDTGVIKLMYITRDYDRVFDRIVAD